MGLMSAGGGGLTNSKLALATAEPSDVISGKTFYAGSKTAKTGTMLSYPVLDVGNVGMGNEATLSVRTNHFMTEGIVIANITTRRGGDAVDTHPTVSGATLTEITRQYQGVYCGSATVVYRARNVNAGTTLTCRATQNYQSNHLVLTLIVLRVR